MGSVYDTVNFWFVYRKAHKHDIINQPLVRVGQSLQLRGNHGLGTTRVNDDTFLNKRVGLIFIYSNHHLI